MKEGLVGVGDIDGAATDREGGGVGVRGIDGAATDRTGGCGVGIKSVVCVSRYGSVSESESESA